MVARVAEREAARLSALEHDVATSDALALLDHRPADEDPVEQVAQREVLRALAVLPARQRCFDNPCTRVPTVLANPSSEIDVIFGR
jgi:hypothetical protein